MERFIRNGLLTVYTKKDKMTPEKLQHHGKRILAIDSELGELFHSMLSGSFAIDTTESYEMGLQLAKENHYGLFILHDEMGYTENKTLPKIQRELKSTNKDSKFIIFSPVVDNVNHLIGEGGFEYVIEKVFKLPFEPREVLNFVKHTLQPKPDSGIIEKFIKKIDPQGKLTGKEREFICREIQKRIELTTSNLEMIILSTGGYTSRTGFSFKDKFIKVDIGSRLKKEHEVYSLDLGIFNEFRPKVNLSEFEMSDGRDVAILAMDNLKTYLPASLKLNKTFRQNFQSCNVPYNLFLMSLFHRSAQPHLDKFSEVIYEGVHGIPHYEENFVPFVNITGEGFKRFDQSAIPNNLIRDIENIIKDYLKHQKKDSRAIIHGDWKEENIVNGYLVDYAMVGRGFEVDELAYYLSDCKFGLDLKHFHECIDTYIRQRLSHDYEFEVEIKDGYGKEMHALADSAFLSQLVLRHSVMNKRDMMDDAKFRQRQYYQHRINQVLKEGRFI